MLGDYGDKGLGLRVLLGTEVSGVLGQAFGNLGVRDKGFEQQVLGVEVGGRVRDEDSELKVWSLAIRRQRLGLRRKSPQSWGASPNRGSSTRSGHVQKQRQDQKTERT